jgi:hypothetical protein
MVVIFPKQPSKTQLQKFALSWMQALAKKDYELAVSMLRQYGKTKLTVKSLQKTIEKTIKECEAVAVKLPSIKAFYETVDFDDFGPPAKKSKKGFDCVGELVFQFCVDGDIVDETIKMQLNQDKDGFSLEFVDMHIW